MSNDNRRFIRRVLYLMIPVLIQNGITNFVNMLDNLMVGQVGDAETAAVAIASQLIFIFNLCIFGAVSGAGIFGAQFYGAGDVEGLRQTFRFKIVMSAVITAAATAILVFFGDYFISLFLTGEGKPEVIARTAELAHDYLFTMLVSLFPFALVQCFASTLRETGRTVLPMAAGFSATLVNLLLNWVLIFGNFGSPKLGVVGAAIATVTSRFAELAIVAVGTWVTRKKGPFIVGAFTHFRIKLSLIKQILIKGCPLILNEMMWSLGMTTLNGFYSTKGHDVVTANSINITFFNVVAVAFFSLGAVISIIIGQTLGAGEIEEAKRSAKKLLLISLVIGVTVGLLYAAMAPFVPHLYNVEDTVYPVATGLMLICAAFMPFEAVTHSEYFTIRSGGKTFITVLFDSGFMWALCVPSVFLLSKFTGLSVFWLYGAVQVVNLIKCVLGFIIVRRGRWATNLVEDEPS